jgi:uncharacterized protein (DUF2336 family)
MTEGAEAANLADGDNIAVSAVREFCLRPRPLRGDMIRLVDLVLPHLNQVSGDSRRQIAGALATSDHAPKALLLALCDFPSDVCSPILSRSSLLNDAELLAIMSQHGEEHARAIARRPKLAMPVIGALRSMESEAVNRALDLRRRLDDAMPSEQRQSFERYEAMMNRELADRAKPLVTFETETFVSLARDPNPVLFRTAVADALGITLASATELCGNPTSRNLIHMMRFLNMPIERAFDVLTALAPDLVDDPAVVTRFEEVFRDTTMEQAMRKVSAWRSDDLMALARAALAANDQDDFEKEGAEFEADSFMKVA